MTVAFNRWIAEPPRDAARRALPARRRHRQVDGEDRALAQLALDVECAAVVAHDVLDDGEAEPGAAQLARAGGIDAVEALGEPRQVLARDALAMVADGDGKRRRALAGPRRRQQARRGMRADIDRGAAAAVLD